MAPFVPALVGLVILALIDPAWAVPLQTALLIVLTIVTVKTGTKVKETHVQNVDLKEGQDQIHADVLKAKANATHAASAAAAAAATARDSSRIVKDVGSLFRATRDPATDPTETTDARGD